MSGNSKTSLILTCVLSAITICLIGLSLLNRNESSQQNLLPIKSMASWQQADAPLGYRADQQPNASSVDSTAPFDHRFIQLSAFEKATIPTVHHFSHAMGSVSGALTYNAQPFWTLNKRRGGHHTGDDLNGIGGMNTDLGDPIYAIGNGLVTYRGEPSPGWGKIVILAHRNLNGEIINSMYAHLEKSYQPYQKIIPAGETIGTVGTAGGRYLAHLHLEMRTSTGIHINNGYCKSRGECISAEHQILNNQQPNYNIRALNSLALILERKSAHMQRLYDLK